MGKMFDDGANTDEWATNIDPHYERIRPKARISAADQLLTAIIILQKVFAFLQISP